MHQRKQIREAIAALLLNETAAGDRVYRSRIRPAHQDKLPCILVYSNSEEVEIFNEAPRKYRRILTSTIEIQAKANEDLDETLDEIAEDVEHALHQDHALVGDGPPSGALCEDTILTGVEITHTDNGSTVIGSCVMTYLTPYYSDAVADPTTENHLDDFDQANVDWKTTETASGELAAQDEIDLSED